MAKTRAISRQSLPDVIANDLRDRILNGDLAEGEVIRQETLAEEYDVSRMPVREALKRLSAGEGTFMERAKSLDSDSAYVREIVEFITGATDRSFLTPKA